MYAEAIQDGSGEDQLKHYEDERDSKSTWFALYTEIYVFGSVSVASICLYTNRINTIL